MTIKSKAFTLIELLVVIAIIGILATIVVANVGSSRTKANYSKIIADTSTIRKSLEAYRAEKGYYPKSDDAAQRQEFITKYFSSSFPEAACKNYNWSYDWLFQTWTSPEGFTATFGRVEVNKGTSTLYTTCLEGYSCITVGEQYDELPDPVEIQTITDKKIQCE